MMKLNRNGMDISLNFIILAVLALIVLIVIALFFTGGLTNLFGKQEEAGNINNEMRALWEAKCEFYCTTKDKTSWYKPEFPKELTAKYASCEKLLTKTWEDKECEKKTVSTIPS